MGFYGNITNTARTQFQFDRVYANRYEMEQKTSTDGVYAGRYCLIEYDREVHTDTLQRVWEFDGAYYTTNSKDATNLLTWGNTTNGMVVFTAETSNEPEDNIYNIKICEFYARVAKPDEAKNSDAAQFIQIADGADAPAYTINYKIDTEAFQIGRGYDSTVWQKVYTDGSEKYVMIAELNTVVPTFDVVADAPTMSPIVPHFDTRSTDVYYKLHWQTPWGFRIAAADDVTRSDAVTSWIKYKYNADTGITIPQCYDPLHEKADENGWRDQTEAEQEDPVLLPKHDAAVYFNRAAFDPKDTSVKRIGKYRAEDNVIKITPTGHSGEKYNKHDGSLDTAALPDTQELTIHLPEIGNMMSDAWDIIHGPNRDDARTDGDGSLQGRLSSFDAFYGNQIPVKRASDGTIIGSKINSDLQYNDWPDKPNEILSDDGITPEFARDDAWIETIIDTTGLKGGDKKSADDQVNNSGISIHHTFHATQNSTSTVDKNNGNKTTGDNYKQAHIRSTNSHHNNDDKIDLYVPYVDAKGHVVGHNIETVTLPYSYRQFNTIGAKPNITSDLYTSVTSETDGSVDVSVDYAESSGQASQTQDTMYIDPYNKWIQVDAQDDLIRIAHAIHGIPTTVNTASNLNAEEDAALENNLNIPDWSYDAAGHIIEKHDHYYTLPYGFKTIQVENTDETDDPKSTINSDHTVADSTQDTLTIAASNYWIKLDNSGEDTIYIGHASPKADDVDSIGYQEEDITDLQFGDPFTLPYIFVDSKGHIADSGYYDITIPKGDFEDKKISSSTANTLTGITFDAPTGKISVTHDNAGNLLLTGLSAANSDTAWVQSTDSINTAFKKVDTRLDAEIARASKAEDDLNKRIDDLDYTDTPDAGQVVYSIQQAEGAVSADYKDVGALLMNGYQKPTTLANPALSATESLNTSIGKLEYRLEDEVKERGNAITKEVSDRNTAITNAINALDVADTAVINQYVSAVVEADGKISVSRTDLPTLSSGSTPGTVKLSNGSDVFVTGLGSAAYTNSSAYASDKVLEDYSIGTDNEGNDITTVRLCEMVLTLMGEVNNLRLEVDRLSAFHEEPETPEEDTTE